MFRTTQSILLLLTLSLGSPAWAADDAKLSDKKQNSSGSHSANAANLAAQGQANAALNNAYLMKAMSKTKDKESRQLMMMMMMQNMQQQAAFAQSARENKKNDSGGDSKKEDEKPKVPMPEKPPAAPTVGEKPDEKLELLTSNPDNKNKVGGTESSDSSLTISPPQIANLGNLNLKKEKTAEEAKAEAPATAGAPAPSTSVPNAIEDAKADKPTGLGLGLNGNSPIGAGAGSGLGYVGGTINPQDKVAVSTASEGGDTFASGGGRGNGGSGSGYGGDGDAGGGGDSRENNFFNSLLNDMMNPPAENVARAEDEVLPGATGESQPNIFEYATLRYQHAAQEEARIRTPQKKRAVTAEIR